MDGNLATRWQPQQIEIGAANDGPDLEELARVERERLAAAECDRGYAEGFAKGIAEGRAKGQVDGFNSGKKEIDRLCAQVSGILASFQKPLSRLDSEVADALKDMAVRVAGTLLQHEYETNPMFLPELIRQALDEVNDQERDVELRLHPDDLGAVTPFLSAVGVRMTPDPNLARGDLRVHTENLRIDGTLDTRLRVCLHGLLNPEVGA